MSDNPYEAPETIKAGDGAFFKGVPGVKNISKVSTITIVMILLTVALSFSPQVYNYYLFSYTERGAEMIAGRIGEEELESFFQRLKILYIITTVAFFITMIMVCLWMYKAMKNTWNLGNTKPTISPAWSVGWYFIPIANLWKPFRGMAQIWEGVVGSSHSKVILHLWWWSWTLSCVLRIISPIPFIEGDIRHLLVSLGVICWMIAVICLIKIIAQVSAYHNSKSVI